MTRHTVHSLVRPVLVLIGLPVGLGGVALVGLAVGALARTDIPTWPVTDAGLLSVALGAAVAALGVAYPVSEPSFGGRLRFSAGRRRRTLVAARGVVLSVGLGFAALGVLALVQLVVRPSGDIFVLGLLAAFAVLELLVGLVVFAGGLAVPAPDDTVLGRVLRYSTRQRRVVGGSLGSFLLLALVASMGVTISAGPVVPFALGAGALVAYAAAASTVFRRLGEAVVGTGDPVR